MTDVSAIDIAAVRREYAGASLDLSVLDADPFAQARTWLDDALRAEIVDATAMTLATADAAGRPGARTVLLKHFDRAGFVFFTSYVSRKARDLDANPRAALLFHWREVSRQLVVEGRVERVSDAESSEYFATRPRGSQLAAAVSPQSREVPDRAWLEDRVAALEARLGDTTVPRPEDWGGYRVVPDRIEVWQGRENRLHDRFEYRLVDGGWRIARLAP